VDLQRGARKEAEIKKVKLAKLSDRIPVEMQATLPPISPPVYACARADSVTTAQFRSNAPLL